MQIRFSGAGMISGGLARMCFHYSGGCLIIGGSD